MKKNLLIISIIISLFFLSIVSLSSQDEDFIPRTIIIVPDEEIPTEETAKIDIRVEVKKDGYDIFTPVKLSLNEKDGFFDMPYKMDMRDKFRVYISFKENEEYYEGEDTDDVLLHAYILNLNSENKLKNIFPGYGGFEIGLDEEIILPSKEQVFGFFGSSGRETFIVLVSDKKISDYEAESYYKVEKDDYTGVKEISVEPLHKEDIEENNVNIYGIYIYTH